MFEHFRRKLAAWFLPPSPVRRSSTRMYAMGRPGRLTSGWGQSTTSEDAEASSSLTTARNRSRELIRDAAYALRAKVIVQNNVIGQGIGIQAKVGTSRGDLNERINDDIELAWKDWTRAEYCHMGQSLHFADFERQSMGQVFEAGEVFIRKHYTALNGSSVPLALELIEPERLADVVPQSPNGPTDTVKLGIEVNQYGAPQAYWMRMLHPGDIRFTAGQVDRVERVPARDILHLRMIDRWPQTRGVPWMHAVGRKFNDLDGLTEAEITAARGAACYMGFIETPDAIDAGFGDAEDVGGEMQTQLDPAIIAQLKPGQKFNFAAPNRPNPQLDPFMRLMLREVAAGVGCSYESLSRDYSQSNYSSSRLALLDDRELWRVLQMWFIRSFRQPLHEIWLQQAVMAKAIPSIGIEAYAQNPGKFTVARFKPRGWSWIDPTKEVEASVMAIKNGFTTVTAVIEATGDGRDLEDVLKERQAELKLMATMGLMFENDPKMAALQLAAKTPAPSTPTQGAATPAAETQTPAARAEAILQEYARRSL